VARPSKREAEKKEMIKEVRERERRRERGKRVNE
jgi:hypothetical protein